MRLALPPIVIAVIVLALYFFVPGVKEQPWTALRITGAILAVAGYVLVITAAVQLGRSFSVQPKATELVVRGLYSRMRNPIYVFLDLMILGLVLFLYWYWLFVVLAALVVGQTFQARREAKVLQEKFGRAYVDYRSQTWF